MLRLVSVLHLGLRAPSTNRESQRLSVQEVCTTAVSTKVLHYDYVISHGKLRMVRSAGPESSIAYLEPLGCSTSYYLAGVMVPQLHAS